MKHKVRILLLTSLLTSWALAGCGAESANSGAESDAVVSHVGVEEFKALMEDSAGVLIDVRTPQEFNEGHLDGAVLIDYNRADFMANMLKLDKERPLLLYCRSGRRSALAATQLKEAGFAKVYNLKDGIIAWRKKY